MNAAPEQSMKTEVDNPFKFLDYYDENDRGTFAGRSEEIVQIMAGFCVARTFVLYGRSGLGKTSLIRAGLFPAMSKQGYTPIYVRILDDPEADLCQAVSVATRRACRPDDLAEALSAHRRDSYGNVITPFVLVLDQFEEFFIRFARKPEIRTAFAQLLGQIASHPDSSVSLIFSLREDYLADLDELYGVLPDIMVRKFRLMPLSGYGARQAILARLNTSSVDYDPSVVNALIERLERVSFNPLVLQMYCSEVFEAARRRQSVPVKLTLADVTAVGEVDDIYRRYLSAVTGGLEPNQTLQLCCLLDLLRTADETKRALSIDDVAGLPADGTTVADVYFNLSKEEAAWGFEYLRQCNLVRRLPSRAGWYELLHDGIVPTLTPWLNENTIFRQFRDADRLITNLHTTQSFLSQRQLRLAIDPFRDVLRLTRAEIEFALRSAVFEESDSVAQWARLYDRIAGENASDQILTAALDSDEHRRAAVVAIGRLHRESFAARCTAIALHDPSVEVRRAAGCAVAAIDRPVDMATIKAAARRKNSRLAATELLADLDEAGRDLSAVGAWTRWRVRRILQKRRLRSSSELIAARALMGAVFGAIGGALWTVAIATPCLYLFSALAYPADLLGKGFFAESGLLLVSVAIAAIVLATWFGRRAIIRVTRKAVLEGRERWLRGIWTLDIEIGLFLIAWFATVVVTEEISQPHNKDDVTRWIADLIPCVMLALCGVFISLKRRRERDSAIKQAIPWPLPAIGFTVLASALYGLAAWKNFELPTAAFFAMVVATGAAPLAMRHAQRGIGGDPNARSIIRTSLLAAVAFGVAPALAILVAMGALENSDLADKHLLTDLCVGFMVGVCLLAFRVPVTIFALGWAGQTYPLDSVRREERSFDGLTVIFFATAVAVVLLFGRNLLPFLANEQPLMQPIDAPFSWNRMRTHYYKLIPPADGAAVRAKVQGPITPRMFLNGEPLSVDEFLFFSPVAARLALHRSSGQSGMARVQFVPLTEIRGALDITHPPNLSRAVLPVTCKNEGAWSGVWSGDLPPGSADPLKDIVMLKPFAFVGPAGRVAKVSETKIGDIHQVSLENPVDEFDTTGGTYDAIFPALITGNHWTTEVSVLTNSPDLQCTADRLGQSATMYVEGFISRQSSYRHRTGFVKYMDRAGKTIPSDEDTE